jgi:hypothetical protein
MHFLLQKAEVMQNNVWKNYVSYETILQNILDKNWKYQSQSGTVRSTVWGNGKTVYVKKYMFWGFHGSD